MSCQVKLEIKTVPFIDPESLKKILPPNPLSNSNSSLFVVAVAVGLVLITKLELAGAVVSAFICK